MSSLALVIWRANPGHGQRTSSPPPGSQSRVSPPPRGSAASAVTPPHASPADPSTLLLPSNAGVSARAPSLPPHEQNEVTENVRRRSTRGTVPSKRNELQQLIGSNVSVVAVAGDQPSKANWFQLAVEHLKSFALGEDWLKLVDKWADLESAMGYGKICKVSLNEWHLEWVISRRTGGSGRRRTARRMAEMDVENMAGNSSIRQDPTDRISGRSWGSVRKMVDVTSTIFPRLE